MEVTLIVTNGVHKGKQIPILTPTFLIGRGKHCHLRPVRPDVGREHCAIVLRGDRVFLRDCNSTNGTILNRQVQVQGEMPLADGDEFEVGPLQFRLAITPSPDDDDCIATNELFTGQPSEDEPGLDSTIQVSSPNLKKPAAPKALPDEGVKLC
jgi:pSer/pThr/pTyr-binding forkhead associated (FHA) protein